MQEKKQWESAYKTVTPIIKYLNSEKQYCFGRIPGGNLFYHYNYDHIKSISLAEAKRLYVGSSPYNYALPDSQSIVASSLLSDKDYDFEIVGWQLFAWSDFDEGLLIANGIDYIGQDAVTSLLLPVD